jgi:CTP:molybdopterin cytidylyltransferase MocA
VADRAEVPFTAREPVTSGPGPPIGAVVLAAGGSSRLGRPKQLVVHDGLPLVARAAHAALQAGADPVVVVLGAGEAAVRAALSDLPVETVVNPRWADGMGTSVAAGVRALLARAPSVGGVLVTLVDQPFVGDAELGRLVDAWVRAEARAAGGGAPAAIAAAAYAGTVGVPAVFGRAHADALCALPAAAGAARLLRAPGALVHPVPMPEAATDVDTHDDLARLLAGERARRG